MSGALLALDTATRCGWAAGAPGIAAPEFGMRNFGGANVSTGEVVAKFRGWLNQRCYDLHPTLIVIEQPFIPHFAVRPKPGGAPPINTTTLRRLLALVETAHAVAWELGIRSCEVTTGEVAKFFVGARTFPGRTAEDRRRAKKSATIEMCRAYGWEVGDDDDAADALAIWCMAEAQVAPAVAAQRGVGRLFIPAPVEKMPRAALAPKAKEPSLFG